MAELKHLCKAHWVKIPPQEFERFIVSYQGEVVGLVSCEKKTSVDIFFHIPLYCHLANKSFIRFPLLLDIL